MTLARATGQQVNVQGAATAAGIYSYDNFVQVYANRPKRPPLNIRSAKSRHFHLHHTASSTAEVTSRSFNFFQHNKKRNEIDVFQSPASNLHPPLLRHSTQEGGGRGGGGRAAQGCCRCWTSTRRSACQAGCSVRAVGVRRRPVLLVR
jgi:hypothetical protein